MTGEAEGGVGGLVSERIDRLQKPPRNADGVTLKYGRFALQLSEVISSE